MKRRILLATCVAQLALTTCGTNTGPTSVVFRDDFNGSIANGWTILRDDPSNRSVTDTSLEIQSQNGKPGPSESLPNVFVREMSGDFTLNSRVNFDPVEDRKFAGILVQDASGHSTVLGLTRASGSRGTFRGVAMLADNGSADPTRKGALLDTNDAYLTLVRTGNNFTAQFSTDGTNFSTIGTLSNVLVDPVQVGIAVSNGDGCSDCTPLPADFDFFEIAVPQAM